MKFMTTEGDRSGVDTPDRIAKARNLCAAACIGLEKIAYKQDATATEIRGQIEIAQSDLTRALAQIVDL